MSVPDSVTRMLFMVAAFAASLLVFKSVAGILARRSKLRLLGAEWGKGEARRLRSMEKIADWHKAQRKHQDPNAIIDDRTWDDLLANELFEELDHTRSRIGQQVLYHRLRSPHSPEALGRFESQVRRFSDDAPTRERVQLILGELNDAALWDLWRLSQPGIIPLNRWFELTTIIPLLMLVCLLTSPFWPAALLGFGMLFLAAIAVRVKLSSSINIIIEPFQRLNVFLDVAATLSKLPIAEWSESITTMKVLIPLLKPLKKTAQWVGRSGETDPFSLMLMYLNLLFLLDFRALRRAAKLLEHDGGKLLELITLVGEFDCAITIASWRSGRSDWIVPDFSGTTSAVRLSGLRHPLLAKPVPHTLTLAPPHGILITGSNMSGKSTLLRNVGVAAIMAQSINTVLATEYTAPGFVIRSCIGRGDDLLGGKSYYLVEVERVLQMVHASSSTTPHLLLFDELFRGTNTVERIAAGEAVLRELLAPDEHGKLNHLVLAATHDGELVDLLHGIYAPWHLEDLADARGLRFTYQLRPGPATSRNALTLLRLNGAPEALLSGAVARAAELDRSRTRGVAHV